jgi:hypothetical protein
VNAIHMESRRDTRGRGTGTRAGTAEGEIYRALKRSYFFSF